VTLDADLHVVRDRFRLDVHLQVRTGEVVALLGPNGAGKSTVLSCLAGLLPLDAGRVRLGEDVHDEPAAGAFVPPQSRGVGVVFQDYLLFPHLSALENVAFGLRSAGRRRREARREAGAWLQRMRLEDLAGARPSALSGGQAQRVALARALAPGPRLLLLDEPLAALDAGARALVRAELRRHLRDFPGCALLVTHDPLDAMVLADRVVVVEQGRVVQTGPPAQVARVPRTAYVAGLVGLNLYRGVARSGRAALDGGGELQAAGAPDGPVLLTFPPSAVSLHRSRPEGSARNAWPGLVSGVEHHGASVRVAVDAQPPVLADVTTAAVAELDLVPGQEVWASVKATEVHAEPAADEAPTAEVPSRGSST
jgi:molybdate transport system ATP-binding protein